MKTIAIDFDGVIHSYDKGWQDGSIYGKPIEGVFESIDEFIKKGYSVFVFSTRSPFQIKKWLIEHTFETEFDTEGLGGDPTYYKYQKYSFSVKIIPFWVKFWNKEKIVGITRRKLPAHVYIDDRALKFNGNWESTANEAFFYKTWQEQ